MAQLNFPPKLNQPRLSIKVESFWTLLGIILGVGTLFPSEIAKLELLYRIAILSSVIIFTALFPPFIKWFIFEVRIIYLRARYYPRMFELGEYFSNELSQTNERLILLFSQISKTNSFTIQKVMYYNNNLYILVEKKDSIRLKIDDLLLVVDMEARTSMGIFKVIQEKENSYYAKGYENISPIWIGYIRQNIQSEFDSPPNSYAILLSEE